jgi:NADP-dependent 3-hydroxy acid dehydrogenase YdfG
MKLANKTALITGGGSGIGLATARVFLDQGARVVIAGRDLAKLDQATKTLAAGERIACFAADVAVAAQVADMVAKANKFLGRIDILVNNAGLNIRDRDFRHLTVETWNEVIRANLDGAFYCMHAVAPQMLERKDGLIINISSTAGKRAVPLSGSAYAASKFGMAALGLCVGAEEMNNGLRVTNIYPGEVDTPILNKRPERPTAAHLATMLKAEDVAAAVLFVATLPPRASVPELVIKPTVQFYV